MIEFELKNGKKIKIVGNCRIEFDKYGDLNVIFDKLEKKSVVQLLQSMDEKLDDDFYSEKIAISEEKSNSVSFNKIQKDKQYNKLMRYKFQEFINVWDTNFGIEDTEQPNRVDLLKETMPYDGKKIMDFIDLHGGLTNGVMQVIKQERFDNDTEFRKYCRLIAENITQVSSIVCPPLATKLEYPFKINL